MDDEAKLRNTIYQAIVDGICFIDSQKQDEKLILYKSELKTKLDELMSKKQITQYVYKYLWPKD